jgi:hypothetical protein
MSWNATLGNPNWGGNNNSSGGGGSDVGNLYTTPNPATIQENPSIGLLGRNEIPLPTKYKDLDVKNLTAETFNKIPVDIRQWALYNAIADVGANLDETGNKQYDINNFRNINCGTLNAQLGVGPSPEGGIVNAAVSVNSPLGAFDVGTIGTCNVNDFLVVEGGTTLDGGATHGTTIGSLPVGGINTVRLDVLPVGIDMVSPTYITMNTAAAGNFAAGGALSVAAGGALSLAGGSYIEYDTSENRFINTTSGNDFTDIKVGNILPAYGGSANLRINGGGTGRGVEIADGTTITTNIMNGNTMNGDVVNSETINLPVYLDYQTWSSTIQYAPTNEVQYINSVYTTSYDNLGVQPASASFPAWDSAESYNLWRYVLYSGVNYVCIAPVLSATTPDVDTTHWTATARTAPQIWTQTDTLLKNYIAFTNDYAGATNYTTLLVPYATTDKLSVLVRNIATNNEVSRGAVYTELNQPPLPSIATTNLDMDGYDITNVGTIFTDNISNLITLNATTGNIDVVNIPQMEMSTTWNATTSYTATTRVIRGTNVYVALLLNRNLDPELAAVPFWEGSTPYGLNDITTIGSGYNYRCILSYAGGSTSPNSDPTHWVFDTFGGIDLYWTFNVVLTNGSITFPVIAGDTKYFQLAKKTGSDGLYIVQRNASTNLIQQFGQIYDTAINPIPAPPPFDPSITTDLNLNNNNINNVNGMFATSTYTYNLGSKDGLADINLLQDIVGTGRFLKDFSTITLKSGISSGGKLQLNNAAGTTLSEYYVNNGSGNTILSATNQLNISATGGVLIDTSLTLPTITTGTITTDTLGGTAGGPIALLTGIGANGESITNINQLKADILGGNSGAIMMESNIDMNGYEITDLNNLVVGELDAPLIKVDTIRPLTNNGVLIQNFVDVKTTNYAIPSCVNILKSNGVAAVRIGSDNDAYTGGSVRSTGILLLNGVAGTQMKSDADCLVAATTISYIQGNTGIEFNTGDANVVSKSNMVIDKNDPVFSLIHLSSANELKMENTGAATSITSDLPLTINGASSISITADTEDINITSTTGSTNIGGTEVNIDSGSINITASAGDVNIEDIVVSGQNITNIDYASLFYSRFGIPDTPNFAWFRYWTNDEFSYSLDSGASWTPLTVNWSKHPAIQDVGIGGYNLLEVNQINVDKVVGFTGTDVSFETNSLTNVDRVNDYAIFKWAEYLNENVVNIGGANTTDSIKFPYDNVEGEGFSLNGSDIIVANVRGAYRILVNLYITKTTSGSAQIYSWFRVNGTDIPYSTSELLIAGGSSKREFLTFNRIIRLDPDDTLEIMWSSSSASAFLNPRAAQTTPVAFPLSPSALINIVCV